MLGTQPFFGQDLVPRGTEWLGGLAFEGVYGGVVGRNFWNERVFCVIAKFFFDWYLIELSIAKGSVCLRGPFGFGLGGVQFQIWFVGELRSLFLISSLK